MKKIIIFCCLLLLTTPAYAKHNKHKNKGHSHHVSNKHNDLPPGLQKEVARCGELPHDWQKKIAKGQRLDDVTYHYLQPVPPDIIRVLPPLPPGVSYKQIEGDIIKIHNANREILDVLKRNHIPIPPLPPLPDFH